MSRIMTPERIARAHALAAQGLCTLHIARAMGLHPSTVVRWARREGITLPDGRVAFNKARGATNPEQLERARALSAALRRLPLNPQERAAYHTIRSAGGYRVISRADAFRAIGRADLVRP